MSGGHRSEARMMKLKCLRLGSLMGVSVCNINVDSLSGSRHRKQSLVSMATRITDKKKVVRAD